MCKSTSRFKAKHSGVSNPSLFLSFRGVGGEIYLRQLSC